jgi:glycosyltransferase involved in cell wall biosynthesis
MRTLYCLRRIDRGGAEQLESGLVVDLNAGGVRCDLACQYEPTSNDDLDASKALRSAGVEEVHWLGASGRGGVALAIARLRKLLIVGRYDVVVTTNPGLDTIAAIARATMRRAPAHVVALHCMIDPETLRSPRLLIWKRLLRFATAAYGVSEYVRAGAVACYGIPAKRVRVVHNCLVHPRSNEGGAALVKKFRVEGVRRTFLWVGRLVESKGLLETLSIVGPNLERWDACLVICGQSFAQGLEAGAVGFDNRLRDFLAGTAYRDRVVLAGYQENARDMMRNVDLLVHLPRNEAFGLVLLEAMNAGLPILAANVGGIPEVLAGTLYRPVLPDRRSDVVAEVDRLLTLDAAARALHINVARERAAYFSRERRREAIAELLADAARCPLGEE